MGRAKKLRSKQRQRAKAERRFSPHDHRVATPSEALHSATSSDALPTRLVDLLSALASNNASEREVAAGSLASLAASLDASSLDDSAPTTSAASSLPQPKRRIGSGALVDVEAQALFRSEVMDALRVRMFDSVLAVRVTVAGVIRNIGVSSLEGAEALMANDGVACVAMSLSKVREELEAGGRSQDEVMQMWMMIGHLAAIAQCMAEATPEAAAALTNAGGLAECLVPLLAQADDVPGQVLVEAAKCIMTLADGNPSFVTALTAAAGSEEALLTSLRPLLAADNALIAVLGAGVLLALVSSSQAAGVVLPEVAPILRAAVAGVDPAATIGDESTDGGAWHEAVVASRMALEMLTNALVVEVEESSDAGAGVDPVVAAAVGPGAVLSDLVLPRMAVLPDQVHALGRTLDSIGERVRTYYGHLVRVVGLATNAWMVLESAEAAAALVPVWQATLQLLRTAEVGGAAGDVVEPALTLASAILQRARLDDGCPTPDASPEVWQMIVQLASTAPMRLVRVKATEVAALLGAAMRVGASADGADALVAFIANQLDDAEIGVVLEAADAVFELLASSAVNAALASSGLLGKLGKLEQTLTAAIEDGMRTESLPEDVLMRADDVVTNLPRFVVYKQQQMSK
ncbi:uncharacterized protein AMSG_04801 [Thecamonas trahens ATCC 50062]|uniref:SYO1-like TPR repeats domain-containing protein n=1 Tax=Thecamonas trahens ATCC 50062 TaxID=461836 RepID=A0A0L0D8E2_THETB|nr:hypothetical protein AMSG_04801 [Thecamonas trahens ATCC 50062]KNC48351.1 hypothetical protein AMSG_04801 [Thecamonas trahens ATCC 50062]|eukprot:XP_013758475.1 hypothetical protein AMSG_04801 [Thecamonas trahens ATCC 50062]